MSDAEIIAVPAETPVTVMPALVAPALTVTGVCTDATAGLLLDRLTATPPGGAGADSVTVPPDVPPAWRLAAVIVTPEMVVPLDGLAGDEELPHRIVATAMISVTSRRADGLEVTEIIEVSLASRGARGAPVAVSGSVTDIASSVAISSVAIPVTRPKGWILPNMAKGATTGAGVLRAATFDETCESLRRIVANPA